MNLLPANPHSSNKPLKSYRKSQKIEKKIDREWLPKKINGGESRLSFYRIYSTDLCRISNRAMQFDSRQRKLLWRWCLLTMFLRMAREDRADSSVAVLVAVRTHLLSEPTGGTRMTLPTVAAVDACRQHTRAQKTGRRRRRSS
jgi:hypothetical protein